jgi:hypothetical protein
MFNLLGSDDDRKRQEDYIVNHQPVSTAELNRWRFETAHGLVHPIQKVPVPNPQNRHYSSIETAKRKHDDAQRTNPRPKRYISEHDYYGIEDVIVRPRMKLPDIGTPRFSIPKRLR